MLLVVPFEMNLITHPRIVGIPTATRWCEVKVKMLYYALVFLLIALVAAMLGFGGIAVAFASIAKILFVVFLILFLVSFVMHLGRRV